MKTINFKFRFFWQILIFALFLQLPCNSAMIGRWSFDSGLSAPEVGGMTTTPTGTFATSTNRPGPVGKSFALNGTSRLTVTHQLSTNAGTFAFWALSTNRYRITDVKSQTLLIQAYGPDLNRFRIWQYNSNYSFNVVNGANTSESATTSDKSFQTGIWQFWACTWNAGTIKLYVDGALIQTTTGVTGWVSPTSFAIGQDWRGYIDELRLYDTALTDGEVITEMVASTNYLPPVTNALIARFSFDDGTKESSVGSLTVTTTGTFETVPTTPSGRVLALNGSSRLNVTHKISAESGTLSAWAMSTNQYRLSDSKSQTVIVQSSIGNNRLKLWQINTNYQFQIQNGSSVSVAAQMSGFENNAWHHWAATWSAGTSKLYIDGELVSTKTYSGAWTNGNIFEIGTDWRGYIDEVRLYSLAMNGDEISNLMETSKNTTLNLTPPPPPPTNQMLARFSFDDGSYTELINGMTVTPTGPFKTSSIVPGSGGKSFALDGANRLTVTHQLSTNKGTFTVWALSTNRYRSDGKAQTILVQGSGPSANRFRIWQYNSNYSFNVVNTANTSKSATTSDKSFQTGIWQFWACTWNAGTIKLYVDGALIQTTTGVSGWISPPTFTIGNEWRGYIDEVTLFNYDLSASEITNVRINSTNIYFPPETEYQPSSEIKSWFRFEKDDLLNANAGILQISGSNKNGQMTEGKLDGGFSCDGMTTKFFASSTAVKVRYGTIAMWVNPKPYDDFLDSDKIYIVGHTTIPAFANRIQIYISGSSGNLNAGFGNNANLMNDLFKLPAEKWTHIALAWNATNLVFYRDGIKVRSENFTGLSSLSSNIAFGYNGNETSPKGHFYGTLDEIKMFRGTLSASEISALANSEKDAINSKHENVSFEIPKISYINKNSVFAIQVPNSANSKNYQKVRVLSADGKMVWESPRIVSEFVLWDYVGSSGKKVAPGVYYIFLLNENVIESGQVFVIVK